jgi:hypothetical protein
MVQKGVQRHPASISALPQQESDFACFKKHPLCGLLLRFQPTHRSTNFPSLKMTGSSYYAFQGSDSC